MKVQKHVFIVLVIIMLAAISVGAYAVYKTHFYPDRTTKNITNLNEIRIKERSAITITIKKTYFPPFEKIPTDLLPANEILTLTKSSQGMQEKAMFKVSYEQKPVPISIDTIENSLNTDDIYKEQTISECAFSTVGDVLDDLHFFALGSVETLLIEPGMTITTISVMDHTLGITKEISYSTPRDEKLKSKLDRVSQHMELFKKSLLNSNNEEIMSTCKKTSS